MKQILLSISLFLGIAVNAQTLTEANHSFIAGDVYSTIPCSTVGITPGGTGAAQSWNYTTATSNTIAQVNYTASAYSGSAYPSANISVASATNNVSYYKSSTTDLKYYGGNLTVGGVNVSLTYSLPAYYAIYPMAITNATTTNVSGSGIVFGFPATFSGQCSISADATGTITLPSTNTYSNVIRVITSQTITASASGNTANINIVNYDYYDPTSTYKAALFTISTSTLSSMLGGTSTQTFVTTIKDNVVGVKENSKNAIQLSVFPNPSTSFVNFTTSSTDAVKVTIADITGRIIAAENIEMGKAKMNTNNLNAGVYLYSVTDKYNQVLTTGKFNVEK